MKNSDLKKGCLSCGNINCDIDVSYGIVKDGCLTWQPNENNISLCPHCFCMTHTIKGKCGKCKAKKCVKK